MNNFLAKLVPRLGANVEDCIVDTGLVTFINPYSYVKLRPYGQLLRGFEKVGVDGISMVCLVRLFLRMKVERISFDMTSLAPLVFRKLRDERKNVFLIGSTEEEIHDARRRLLEKFPDLCIAGTHSGYFATKDEWQDSIQKIKELGPNAVVVGMGTPLQEQYLADLWRSGWRGAGYTCGGFFHQIAKKLDYYPAWIDRFNLRWAYRIWDEPRLIRRYSIDYPRAVRGFIVDVLKK